MNLERSTTRRYLFYLIGFLPVLFVYREFVLQVFSSTATGAGSDWNWWISGYEVIRNVILKYHQFPWWNPWSVGGYPLFANPSLGVFSPSAASTLALGAVKGTYLGLLIEVVLGYTGMIYLAREVTLDPVFRWASAALFCCNGGILIHCCVGHPFPDYYFLPWILGLMYAAFDRASTDRTARHDAWLKMGLAAAMLALQVYSILVYGFIYTCTFIVLVMLIALARSTAKKDTAILASGFWMIFLSLASVRLITTNQLMHDFPRNETILTHPGLRGLLSMFFSPFQQPETPNPIVDGYGGHWWEYGCYIGVIPAMLFAYSFWKKRRPFHWITLGVLAVVFSSRFPYPYYWLSHYVPIWKSMRVGLRIRIWLMPFLGLALASGLALIGIRSARSKRIAYAFSVLLVLDLAINATAIPWHEYLTEPPSIHHSILSTPNTKPYPITFRTPTTPGYNFEKSEPPFYTLVRNNYTHFHGMEPAQLPILVGKSDGAIRGINESGYRGEFYDRNGPIEPSYWSPNEIRFENVSEPIWLNLNRSSYWHLNGKPLPNAKLVADYDTPFEAHPDERQVVDLKIVPKGFGLSLWLSAFFGICAVALYAFDRRLRADAN